MTYLPRRLAFLLPMLFASIPLLLPAQAQAGDWPVWRYDAARGAATPDALPENLHLQWVLRLPAPSPAWPPEQTKLQFDASCEPVVAGGRLFVPSMVYDCVIAFDTKTGAGLWRFYTEGPVRFAPVANNDKVYFVSDDGYLYCVDAADGKLVWKFRGGPSDRKVIGNGRLISMWPARGAPVLYDGKIYFAAGIWPFMGTFIHSLNAETGEVVWTNSGSGSTYTVQPHSSPAFAGVAPQGYLAATERVLLVSGGRTLPAAYDRETGKLLYYHVGKTGKGAGGYEVFAGKSWFGNGGVLYDLATGNVLGRGTPSIVGEKMAVRLDGRELILHSAETQPAPVPRAGTGASKGAAPAVKLREVWRGPVSDEIRRIHILAGDRVYASADGSGVLAVDLPKGPQSKAAVSWRGKISGEVWNMLAADDRLFVVSRQGWIFCFGAEEKNVSLPPLPANGQAPGALVKQGATWKYLDDGSDQKTAWRAAGFDDSAWRSGRAELGYGDGDEATVVRFGPDKNDKFVTTYFRHAFTVPSGTEYESLELALNVDDGAVVYANGKEAARVRMPRGNVASKTFATRASGEGEFKSLEISPQLLTVGRNVLAVEVHQASKNSSDISFDLELTGTRAKSGGSQRDEAAAAEPQWTSRAGQIVKLTGVTDGYCVVFGYGDGHLVEELAKWTDLYVIVVEPDPDTILAARNRLVRSRLLGRRVSLHTGNLQSIQLPPYLANLIICEDSRVLGGSDQREVMVPRLFHSLRPYGGVAVLGVSQEAHQSLAAIVQKAEFPNAKLTRGGDFTLLWRPGALPGSAPWTHHNADAGNTMMSRDERVKAPLGLLWFGGPSNTEVLPRHGHGPSPQVVGGRVIVQGPNMLRALDVYTGRLLWQRNLPEVGIYYNNTGHHPGAGGIGGNYVSLADGIYVAYGRECLRLDPATGKTLAKFELPPDDSGKRPHWGYIGVYEDLLIAGSSPIAPLTEKGWADAGGVYARFAEGSRHLVVMDRNTGKVLWTRRATHNFRHNSIAAGGGKVFCIDRITSARRATLQRRGAASGEPPKLYALDARTGNVVWETGKNVFGTWLGYSRKHDLLLQAGSRNRDRAGDEAGQGMVAYRAETGDVLWQNDDSYGGPCLLHDDAIFTQGAALDVATGKPRMRKHPLSGAPINWSFARNYGCNTVVGCVNLLTFRSAAAGYFDLAGDGGTGNFGGFKSSCTANLIPADGVLNAPDYTRTCACSYQNQCSLAMVHMPEVEMWTFNAMNWDQRRVHRVGINFGAPGDRRAGDGTLWLDYPSQGGPSPNVPIEVSGDDVRYYRYHSSRISGDGPSWVAASGVRGARTIRITLAPAADAQTRKYTVALHFAEVDSVKPGGRVFSVSLQGKRVLENFDIASRAGGVGRLVVYPLRGISIGNKLEITLIPKFPDQGREPILSGVEVVLEE